MRKSDCFDKARQGDEAACEVLLKENSRLIWSIVRRFMGRGVEMEDLYQLGSIGFLKALQGYDSSYGTCFSTYAVPKIAGEMRRYIRDHGAIKVSRGIREQGYLIYRTRIRLLEQLGREATLSEVANELGLSVEEIAVADQAGAAVISIQSETGEGATLEDLLTGENEEDRILEEIALREAIRALPQREQMVIMLRYFRDMTQQQTAKIVGVSQVQISRIEKKAISMLRAQFQVPPE